jgi:protein-disulfide isomerase
MAAESWLARLARRLKGEGRRGWVVALLVILVGASVAIAATQGGPRQPAPAVKPEPGFSADPETARIERIVREYLLAHPEVIQEAADALRDKQLAQVVDSNRSLFETPFGSAWAGAEKGDVVLVEFFDYACGYCRASNPDIERLLKEDSKLKVVWRELPVLGPDSMTAAQASLAAARQGKFRAFHQALFAQGLPTAEALAKARAASGATAADSTDFQAEIDKNFELARAVGVNGTPVFLVGTKVFQGAVGYDVLKQAIAEARLKR